MKVPRFWHCEWLKVPSKYADNKMWRLPRWGWSDLSQEDAERIAKERAAKSIELWNRSQVDNSGQWYHQAEYFVQPPREEILQEIVNDEGEVDGWVSRNRYGVLVLNTDVLLIVDVDRQETPLRKKLGSWLNNWLGKPVESEEAKLISICQSMQGESFRVYRTFAGWRVLLISRAVTGINPETIALLSRFPVDKQYLKLCEKQRCFRARLSAKPWRVGCERMTFPYPRDARHERSYSEWEESYIKAAAGFRTCEKIFGEDEPCQRLRSLVELHDQLCQVDQFLPLA